MAERTWNLNESAGDARTPFHEVVADLVQVAHSLMRDGGVSRELMPAALAKKVDDYLQQYQDRVDESGVNWARFAATHAAAEASREHLRNGGRYASSEPAQPVGWPGPAQREQWAREEADRAAAAERAATPPRPGQQPPLTLPGGKR